MTTETKENENTETVEIDESEMLDVVSAAVDEATPDDILAANKETTEIESGAEQTPEEKAAAAKEDEDDEANESSKAGETEGGKTDEEKAAEAAKKTPEEKAAEDKAAADAFEKLTPEEKVAAEKAAEEAAEKIAAAAAKEVDPVNDPIPEATNEKTATRIKALIQIAKDNTVRADQADEIVGQITDTGADPDQYANTLGFLKLYNSKDPVMRKQALAAAEGVVRELRIELGEGTVDLLDNHDDLKAEIEAGTLTEARAVEIATGREKATLDGARLTAANNKTADDEQTAANIAEGKAQLTSLETTLNASDPEYTRLRPTFIAMLKPALRKAHASEWGEVAQEIYVEVKKANPAVAPVVPVVPTNTPLRPKSSGGGSADKDNPPDSALAAVNAALGSM